MKDKFTKKALAEGYKARSVFKLRDMDRKFHLINKGDRVLDIGAAPGSWSQYAVEKGAIAIAVDIESVNAHKVKYIKADIFDDVLFEKVGIDYDLVMSDVAPKTTGIIDNDNYNSFNLSSRSLEIAKKVLKRNGNYVCKIFQGEYFDEFHKEVKKTFRKVRSVKPEASRKKSKEIYLIGIDKL